MLINQKHPITSVRSEYNAIFTKSADMGEPIYYGPGTEVKLTATSVVSDLTMITRNIRLATTGHMFNPHQHKARLTGSENIFGQYYFSLNVPDTPGQFLQSTQLMTKAEVSFDQLVQQKSDGWQARAVAITHQVSKAQMQ